MYDRPDLTELLDAVRQHLENVVIPAVRADRKLYFQTLVAINVLRIATREIAHAPDHAAAEWARLNALTHERDAAPTALADLVAGLAQRNRALCAGIRAGYYDAPDRQAALYAHVMASSIAQLEVANPRFLQTLAAEDAAEAAGDDAHQA